MTIASSLATRAVLAAGALMIALPAAAQPSEFGGCFLTRDIRNHTVGDDHTMYIDVGGRAVYKVAMSNNCLAGSTSSDPYVLRDRTSTGRICHKIDFDVRVRGTGCIVDSVSKLTPAEAAALPKHARP
jgi:hypothetical protein